MKYPVTVFSNRGMKYAMLTLEEANQPFVVVDGLLVVQDIRPMTKEYAERTLAEECAALEDAQEYIKLDLTKSQIVKTSAEILRATINIAVLREAQTYFLEL
jgi:hypothetical protein